MPDFASRSLVLLAALVVGLVGCGGEAEPTEVPVEETTAPASGATWDVSKGSALPGDSPEAEQVVIDEPVEAPVVAPPPPVSAPEPTQRTIVDRDDHVDFALDFLGRQAYNSVDGLMGLYAGSVRYFDRGTVSRGTVATDKGNYFERWPNRYYELSGPVRATGGSRPVLRFDYDFAVSDFEGSGERTGRAWVELGLTPSTNGYVIASERGGTY